jgi:type II secretory pathway pseudopilin PulG
MEVLVGVAILGIVYSILFGLMSASLRNVSRIEEREKVIRYGQMKLNELAIKASQGKSEQVLAGQFDEKYRWQARVERISFGEDADKNNSYRLASVHLSVTWTGRSQQNQYDLDTTTWVPREE